MQQTHTNDATCLITQKCTGCNHNSTRWAGTTDVDSAPFKATKFAPVRMTNLICGQMIRGMGHINAQEKYVKGKMEMCGAHIVITNVSEVAN